MSREVRIGIFVGAAVIVLTVFIFIVGDLSVLFHKPGYSLNALFDTAAGLDKRAAVKMAGVPVGHVKDIRIDGRKALVVLTIYAGREIPKGSRATFSQLGLLGEKYVEILPGDTANPCVDGDMLPGSVTVGFDQIGPLLSSLSEEIKSAAASLRGTLDEETRAGVKQALASAAGAADELKTFLGENRGELGLAARGAARTFDTAEKALTGAASDLERTLALIRDTVRESGEALRSDLETIRRLAGRVEESLNLFNASLAKINRGEGTAGRLVQDPALYEEARAAVRGVASTTRGLSSLRASLDIQAGYYGRSELVRAGIAGGLWLTPRSLLEAALVRDPWDESFRFSLQGAYRFGNVVPRFGFIESEFGLGVDYYGGGDRWRLSLEGFDWNRADSPRFRFAARVFPWARFYLTAGLDDFSLARRREIFLGLGLVLR